ncbi:MAG: pitrilysin family protein [Acidobacteriota bacterium]
MAAKLANFDNGLRLIVRPDRRVPLISLHVCCLVGARDDRSGRSGTAHLAEHLAFDGPPSEDRRTYPRRLSRVGGQARASTFQERTTFSATVPRDQLDLALAIEAERLSPRIATFTDEALEVQRQVLLQERLQRVDNRPYGTDFERLQRLLYPEGHPYRRLPSGTPDELGVITRADVESHFVHGYTAGNAVVCVVGDIVDEQIEAWAEQLSGHQLMRQPAPAPLGPLASARHDVHHDDVPAPRVYLAFRGPGHADPDWHAASLFMHGLAVGRHSLLWRRLVSEAGLARDLRAQTIPMRQASTMVLVATAASSVTGQRLADALVAALETALDHGFAASTVERARNKALTDHYWAWQRPARQAEILATRVAFGRPLDDDEQEGYAAVTTAELRIFADRYCRAENRQLMTVLPRDAGVPRADVVSRERAS